MKNPLKAKQLAEILAESAGFELSLSSDIKKYEFYEYFCDRTLQRNKELKLPIADKMAKLFLLAYLGKNSQKVCACVSATYKRQSSAVVSPDYKENR